MVSSKFLIRAVTVVQGDIYDADILDKYYRYGRICGIASLSLGTYIDTVINKQYR